MVAEGHQMTILKMELLVAEAEELVMGQVVMEALVVGVAVLGNLVKLVDLAALAVVAVLVKLQLREVLEVLVAVVAVVEVAVL
jgi:hypothetical protein